MPIEFKDYYALLGVPKTASEEEIKKAFRKLARQFHPDVAKDKRTAEAKFKEINEAYEVLGDPAKRKKYDTLGANWKAGAGFEPPPGMRPGARTRSRSGAYEFHFGGTGFSDFFEQFFGGGGGGRSADFEELLRRQTEAGHRGRDFVERGADAEGTISVSLDEVMHGSVRSVTLQSSNPNTGETETQTFKVRIPAGVQEGQTIRVPGKGGEGSGGGAAGDLYLRVSIAAHPEFRVRGADLYHDLELAPWEAALGATISIPTLEGQLSMRIPAGTNTGQQLRVRGRGLPRGPGTERGDLYVVASIQVPANLSAEERDLWQKLARASSFRPREG